MGLVPTVVGLVICFFSHSFLSCLRISALWIFPHTHATFGQLPLLFILGYNGRDIGVKFAVIVGLIVG